MIAIIANYVNMYIPSLSTISTVVLCLENKMRPANSDTVFNVTVNVSFFSSIPSDSSVTSMKD